MVFIDFYESFYFLILNFFIFLSLIYFSYLITKKICSQRNFDITFSLMLMVITIVVFWLEMILIDFYFNYKLESFDIDGDGFFSPEEDTIEKERIMNRVTNDTGKFIFFFLLPIGSIAISFMVYALLKIRNLIKHKKK